MIVSSVISRPVQGSVLSNTYAANMAALKAIDISEMASNTQISVAGYYTPGDGGGGTFYYDSGSSSTDDGGTIIAPNVGGGRWKRVCDRTEMNIRWFGAKGDSTSDDTAAIQAAIDTTYSIYIPRGRYKITSALNLTSNSPIQKTVRGDGWDRFISHASVIDAQTDGVALDLTATYNVSLRDFSIISSGRPNPSTVGVLYARAASPGREYCNQNTINNVNITLEDVSSANNGLGSVGIYNIASEMHNYNNVQIFSNTPVFVGSTNVGNVVSPYVSSFSTKISTCNVSITGSATSLRSITGGAHHILYLKQAVTFSMFGGSMATDNAADMDAAIYMDECTHANLIGIHIEDANRVIQFAGVSKLVRVSCSALKAFTTTSPLDLGSDAATQVLGLELRCLGNISGASAIVAGVSGQLITNLVLEIDGDDNTAATSAGITDIRGIRRMIKTATAGQGGFQSLGLSGSTKIYGTLTFSSNGAAGVGNSALFRDSADNKLKYKDNTGTVHDLY